MVLLLRLPSLSSVIRFGLLFVDSIKDGEERWHAIGMAGMIPVLVVVHTSKLESADEDLSELFHAVVLHDTERKRYEEGY